MLFVTKHAKVRQSNRAISDEALAVALRYGRAYYGAGACHVFLAGRDLPPHFQRQRERFEGLTLVIDSATSTLLTAFRDRAGLGAIKKKEDLKRHPTARRRAPRRGTA